MSNWKNGYTEKEIQNSRESINMPNKKFELHEFFAGAGWLALG
jgi:hypothetical protein